MNVIKSVVHHAVKQDFGNARRKIRVNSTVIPWIGKAAVRQCKHAYVWRPELSIMPVHMVLLGKENNALDFGIFSHCLLERKAPKSLHVVKVARR
jgi:hypothetical protein